MAKKQYAEFEIWVEPTIEKPSADGMTSYPTQVVASPAGQATGSLLLDLGAKQFQQALDTVTSDSTDLNERIKFGQKLFEALFNGEVRDRWNRSLGKIEQGQAEGLRLRLNINAPEIARLPWELLCDPDEQFLATVANQGISRFLPVPEPPFLPSQKIIRILVVVESPNKLPEINEEEIKLLEEALTNIGDRFEYKLLRNANLKAIHDEVQSKDYHILHFLGHGLDGKLALSNDNGEIEIVDDTGFASLFHGRRTLRLAVLNACSSSQSQIGGLFSGVGPALVQKRIPAVVAMQYPSVSIKTAGLFSERFYKSLSRGYPIDISVNEARQYLSATSELSATRDWSTPILYMGLRSGEILHLANDSDDTFQLALESVQEVAAQSEKASQAWLELTSHSNKVTLGLRCLYEWLELERRLRQLKDNIGPLIQEARRLSRYKPEEIGERMESLESLWQYCPKAIIEIKTFGDSIKHLDNEPEIKRWIEEFQESSDKIQASFNNLEDKGLLHQIKRFENLSTERIAKTGIYLQSEVRQLSELSLRMETQLDQ